MQSILLDHNRRYPHWSVEDLYKLVHQASMGSEHALSDENGARAWLNRELAQLGSGPADPLIDPISPDNLVVRVHLRPFANRRLDPEALLQAFIRTASEFTSSVVNLRAYASAAIWLAEEAALPFHAGQISTFFAKQQAVGYPAVHHSQVYEADYHPAYRVVARNLLPKEIAAAG